MKGLGTAFPYGQVELVTMPGGVAFDLAGERLNAFLGGLPAEALQDVLGCFLRRLRLGVRPRPAIDAGSCASSNAATANPVDDWLHPHRTVRPGSFHTSVQDELLEGLAAQG